MGAQFAQHKGGEQWVVGIPLTKAIQRLQEEPVTLQLLEHPASIAALSQSVGQRCVEAIQQTGRLEEIQRACAQVGNDLLAHVIANIRMAELQVFQEQVHTTARLHLLQNQLQCARPAADTPVQALDLLAVDRNRQAQIQQRLNFVGFEGQMLSVNGKQLMLDP